MTKKLLSLALALALCFRLAVSASAAGAGTAYMSIQSVRVDNRTVQFQMFALRDANGGATNYIKLRDVAYVLKDTPAKFSVDYDNATGMISLTAGRDYTNAGMELMSPFDSDQPYRNGSGNVMVNGKTVHLDAIVLTDKQGGGYTYFKLRDLGDALGFQVDWSARDGITVKTDAAAQLTPEELAAEVVRLVNVEREKQGLKPLGTFQRLTDAAALRAPEIAQHFSHDRPDGSSCFTAMDETGARNGARKIGENIAAGQTTPAAVVETWMNSSGHRANILTPEYTHIGVGYYFDRSDRQYGHYWVQMFAQMTGTPGDDTTVPATPAAQATPQTPAQSGSERIYYTDENVQLLRTSIDDLKASSSATIHSSLTQLQVYEAWGEEHGGYTVAWSVDDPYILRLQETEVNGLPAVSFQGLHVGEAKIICTVTCADGTEAEAYCYVTVIPY